MVEALEAPACLDLDGPVMGLRQWVIPLSPARLAHPPGFPKGRA